MTMPLLFIAAGDTHMLMGVDDACAKTFASRQLTEVSKVATDMVGWFGRRVKNKDVGYLAANWRIVSLRLKSKDRVAKRSPRGASCENRMLRSVWEIVFPSYDRTSAVHLSHFLRTVRVSCRNERPSPRSPPSSAATTVAAARRKRNRSGPSPRPRRSRPKQKQIRMLWLPPSSADCRIRSPQPRWRILPIVPILSASCWRSQRKVCRWAVPSARLSVRTLISVLRP